MLPKTNRQKKYRFSFNRKLLLGEAILFGFIALLFVLANNLAIEAESRHEAILSEVVDPLTEMGNLQAHIYRLRAITANLTQNDDYFAVSAEIAELENEILVVDKALAEFCMQNKDVYGENTEQIKKKWGAVKSGLQDIVQAAVHMDIAEIEKLSIYQAYPRFISLIKETEILSAQIAKDAELAYETSVKLLEAKRTQFNYISISAIIIGFILIFVFARSLSRRVSYLHEAFRHVADGKIDYEVNPKGNDELAELAVEFNKMREKVSVRQKALEHAREVLEERVQERTAELAEKNKELELLARTDRLTGLSNRRSLDRKLSEELTRSRRSGRGFGVIIADIDHFKSVNDNYGHQVGDEVLKEVAQIFKEHTRQTDFPGRWGGEEFMIICPDIDEVGIARLSKKLCKAMEDHDFPVVGSKTSSFGVALSSDGDSVENIVKRADDALYQAKERGRNRVVFS